MQKLMEFQVMLWTTMTFPVMVPEKKAVVLRGMNKFILELGELFLVNILKLSKVEMNTCAHLEAESEILPS